MLVIFGCRYNVGIGLSFAREHLYVESSNSSARNRNRPVRKSAQPAPHVGRRRSWFPRKLAFPAVWLRPQLHGWIGALAGCTGRLGSPVGSGLALGAALAACGATAYLAAGLACPTFGFFYAPIILAYAVLVLPRATYVLLVGVVACGCLFIHQPWSGSSSVVAVASVALATGLAAAAAQAHNFERTSFGRAVDLVAQIPDCLDPNRVLQMAVETAAIAMNAKAASVRLLDSEGEALETRATYGLSESYLGKGKVLPKHSAIDRRVLRGEIVQLHDAAADQRFQYPEAAAREGIASVVCVPLRLGRKPVGVLRVYTAQPRRFADYEVRLLVTFGAVAALAIQNADSHQAALTYLSTVAHELRSPLATVRTVVAGVASGLTGDVSSEQHQMLQRAVRRIDSLLDLVNDLLALSKLRMGLEHADPELISLNTTIRTLAEQVQPQSENAGPQVAVSLCSDEARVWMVRQHLDELLGNIVSNAVKYTPPGGSVHISLSVLDGYARVSVADTGMGIPPEDLPAIGTEFKRARNARQSDLPGTGLGLSIVRGVLSKYRGDFNISSRLGEGTTVEVSLPLAQQADPGKSV